jgi:LysM repeat protein
MTGPEMLVAALLGALIAVGGLLALNARRARARRRAADEAARRAEADLALDRLAWLTGRSEQPPAAPYRPAGPVTSARHVARFTDRALSPRQRLWRDTSAVLLIGLAGVLLAWSLLPPARDDGAVLEATATPGPRQPPPASPPAPGPEEPAPSPAQPAPPEEPSPAAPGDGASETPSPTVRVHVVVRGDTLSSIGLAYGTTVDAILAANPQIADPNLIVVGERIVIPPPAAPPPAP